MTNHFICFIYLMASCLYLLLLSGYQLVQTALDLKHEYIGPEKTPKPPNAAFKRREFWDVPPVRDFELLE